MQPTKGAIDRNVRQDIDTVGARWRYDPVIVAPGSRKALSAAALPARFSRPPMSNIDELKSTGLKATLPRLKILEVFQNAKRRHMTAEDVYRVLLEEHSDIGLATVYRVLMQFEQASLLTRSNFESGKAVFELNEGQHHDHLVCMDCGRVEEFFDPEIEKRQQLIAKTRGFVLQEHALSLYASCSKSDCQHRKS